MALDLTDLTTDRLHDLARLRDVPGHTEMTRDDLLGAMDEPAEKAVAEWLGKPRQEIYEAAKAAGVEGTLDMDKAALIRALADRS